MKRAGVVPGVSACCFRAVALVRHKISVLALALAFSALAIHAQQGPPPLSVTPNVNVMSGVTDQFVGDKFLQRQNEPVIGVSTLNPDHLMAAANDYRTVDMALDAGTGESGQSGDSGEGALARRSGTAPRVARNGRTRARFPPAGATAAEAWMGVYFSYDRGKHWTTGLLPGHPFDTSSTGLSSPIYGYAAATDPVMAVMTAGRFALAGVAFTPGGQSAMFVSNWRDTPIVEGKHSIVALGTHIVVQLGSASSNGVFTDKPALISDVNRTSPDPEACGPLYLAFSIFDGVTSNGNFRTKLMFTRSLDCGSTWLNPFKINGNFNNNQGLSLGVSPTNGHVYAVWRALNPNQIMMVKSTDGGLNFTSPSVISGATAIPAFDEPTAGSPSYSFRTNALPTIVADAAGRLHVAWQARRSVNGAPLIFGTMSANGGNTWSAPHPLQPEWSDTPPRGSAWALDGVPAGTTRIAGPQVMPNYVFNRGRLMLLYYEAYGDISPNYISGITREIATRVVQLDPADEHVISSAFMSRYAINSSTHDVAPVPGSSPPARAVNRPNLPMYKAACCPFIGDYITLAASAAFIRNGAAAIPAWIWATSPNDPSSATFHSVWTDNRDVVFPGGNINGDWAAYSPPGTGAVSCLNAGSRNANIYTAELASRLIAGSPRTSKALFGTTRAFVTYAQNRSSLQRFFRFSLPAAAPASFSQDASVKTRDVAVVPFGSATQTAFVTSTQNQSVVVTIAEITGIGGSIVSGGDTATAVLNPDPASPELGNPELGNTELHNPELGNPELGNPELGNPELGNPELGNPELGNTSLGEPQVTNTGTGSPNLQITDVTFTTTTSGPTASAYQGLVNVTNVAALLASGHRTALLVYRTYRVPSCRTLPDGSSTVVELPVDQLISAIFNPTLDDPNQPLDNTTALQLATPTTDPTFPSSTFYVAPPPPPGSQPDGYRAELGPDSVNVTLRIYHDHGPEVPETFDPLFVSHGVTAHARNVVDGVTEAKARAKFHAPDLATATAILDATPNQVYVGETVSIPAVSFVNQGNAPTNSARRAFSARAYLTTHLDPIVKSTDIPLGDSQQFGVIEPTGGGTFGPVTVRIPATTKASALITPGSYYLRVVIDDGNGVISKNAEVVESEEANNFVSMPILVLPGADLKLAANPTVSLPNRIAPGETFNVSAFTVVNQGTANTLNAFRNRFELFPGTQSCPPSVGAPTVLTDLYNNELFAGAQTAWGPSIVPVPRTTPPGTYTLRLGADGVPASPWNEVFERDEISLAGSGLNNQACYTVVVSGTPAPDLITFTQQPASAQVGVTMAPVTVKVTTDNGAPVKNGQVSIAISSGPLGGSLTGTLKVTLNNSGTASFSDLKINLPGSYTLIATMSGASAGLSARLVVVP
jgi:hypothetical protein